MLERMSNLAQDPLGQLEMVKLRMLYRLRIQPMYAMMDKRVKMVANFRWIILLFLLTNHGVASDQGDTNMNTAIEMGDIGTRLRIGIAKHQVENMVANNRFYILSLHKYASNGRSAVKLKDFSESLSGENVRQKLLVLERDTLVQVIPGILIDYVWSPDGNTLVYMMADQPREVHNFANQIGVYDAKTRTNEMIISNVEFQYGRPLYLQSLNWAEFDNQIYVSTTSNEEPVFRLDLDSKQLVLTDYKGIMFSPDGDYYFNHNLEIPVVVYRRETNEVIWDGESPYPWFTQFIAWHKNERNEIELYLQDWSVVAVVNCTSGDVKIIQAPRRGAQPRFENGRISWK